MIQRRRPGEVRDAIVTYLRERMDGASTAEIRQAVSARLGGDIPDPSVRAYLRLNVGEHVERTGRGQYRLRRR